MLLALEIILTVAAWRRGYKALALLPVCIVMALGFFIGFNDPELAVSDNMFDFIWLDILAIIVLVIMIATGKQPVKQAYEVTESQTDLDSETVHEEDLVIREAQSKPHLD